MAVINSAQLDLMSFVKSNINGTCTLPVPEGPPPSSWSNILKPYKCEYCDSKLDNPDANFCQQCGAPVR